MNRPASISHEFDTLANFTQFQQIVASIREQKFNREAEESGDFIEFLGLAGSDRRKPPLLNEKMSISRLGASSSVTDTKWTLDSGFQSIPSCVR